MLESDFLIFPNFSIFLRNFLPQVVYERNLGLKFFSPILGLSHPVFAKHNTGKRFFNFLNVFRIFFVIFFPGSNMNGIRDLNFILCFSASLILFLLNIILERVFFLFFEFFCYFFRNFLAQVEYERNSGLKFYFLFLGLSHPVFAKHNTGKRFFNFLNFFAIFFVIFLPGSSMNGIRY